MPSAAPSAVSSAPSPASPPRAPSAPPAAPPAAPLRSPPRRPLVGHLLDLGRDPLAFLTTCAREYGDVVPLRLAGWPALLVSDPALVEEVLVAEHRGFHKHRFFWRHVRRLFGDGLLTSEGETWRRQRRLVAPAFQPARVAGYGDAMVRAAERATAAWRDGERRDAAADMTALTAEIVAATLFGAAVGDETGAVAAAFEEITAETSRRFRRPLAIPDVVPTPGNLRYARGVRRLERIVARFVAERVAAGDAGGRRDLLDALLAARDEDGHPMSPRRLRDELITLFLAGHETTAVALSWTWALLAEHPAAERALHAELDAVLGARAPTVDDIPALLHTACVLSESLRLYPPAWLFGREAVADCTIGGHRVAAGTTVLVSPWVLHRDPRWFDAPEAFRPERWSNGAAHGALPRCAYMPFGAGPRVCVGNRFALTEATLLLAAVARAWRLRPASPGVPRPLPRITLRQLGGVPVVVTRRAAGADVATSPS